MTSVNIGSVLLRLGGRDDEGFAERVECLMAKYNRGISDVDISAVAHQIGGMAARGSISPALL